jgi:hypothetical protein
MVVDDSVGTRLLVTVVDVASDAEPLYISAAEEPALSEPSTATSRHAATTVPIPAKMKVRSGTLFMVLWCDSRSAPSDY